MTEKNIKTIEAAMDYIDKAQEAAELLADFCELAQLKMRVTLCQPVDVDEITQYYLESQPWSEFIDQYQKYMDEIIPKESGKGNIGAYGTHVSYLAAMSRAVEHCKKFVQAVRDEMGDTHECAHCTENCMHRITEQSHKSESHSEPHESNPLTAEQKSRVNQILEAMTKSGILPEGVNATVVVMKRDCQ